MSYLKWRYMRAVLNTEYSLFDALLQWKRYHAWHYQVSIAVLSNIEGGGDSNPLSEINLILIEFQIYLSIIFFFKKLGVVVAETSPFPFSFPFISHFPLPPFPSPSPNFLSPFSFLFLSLLQLLRSKLSGYNSWLYVPWDHQCSL